MLKRERIRRYLIAILSTDVIQDDSCEKRKLWKNCDGKYVEVSDSPTHEIFENADRQWNIKPNDIAIAIAVDNESYAFKGVKINDNSISFHIDIISNNPDGHLRQNMLDTVQERILYRIINQPNFTDPAHPDLKLTPFITWSKNTQMTLRVSDDTEYDGSYTIRKMDFVISTNECIKPSTCNTVDICFDFSKSLKIGGCNA